MVEPRVITITRESALARGFDGVWLHRDYDHRLARQFIDQYPNCLAVDVTRPTWNTSQVRYTPKPYHVLYVKATGGHWGKSARVRVSPELRQGLAKGASTNDPS